MEIALECYAERGDAEGVQRMIDAGRPVTARAVHKAYLSNAELAERLRDRLSDTQSLDNIWWAKPADQVRLISALGVEFHLAECAKFGSVEALKQVFRTGGAWSSGVLQTALAGAIEYGMRDNAQFLLDNAAGSLNYVETTKEVFGIMMMHAGLLPSHNLLPRAAQRNAVWFLRSCYRLRMSLDGLLTQAVTSEAWESVEFLWGCGYRTWLFKMLYANGAERFVGDLISEGHRFAIVMGANNNSAYYTMYSDDATPEWMRGESRRLETLAVAVVESGPKIAPLVCSAADHPSWVVDKAVSVFYNGPRYYGFFCQPSVNKARDTLYELLRHGFAPSPEMADLRPPPLEAYLSGRERFQVERAALEEVDADVDVMSAVARFV